METDPSVESFVYFSPRASPGLRFPHSFDESPANLADRCVKCIGSGHKQIEFMCPQPWRWCLDVQALYSLLSHHVH